MPAAAFKSFAPRAMATCAPVLDFEPPQAVPNPTPHGRELIDPETGEVLAVLYQEDDECGG